MVRNLREKMLHELETKTIFEQARHYAFDYADNVRKRNVFPTDKAIADLDKFTDVLPQTTGEAHKVLELLNQYGSSATVAQTGGRYFGFVDGGVLPVSLAVRWLSDFWDQNTALYVMSPLASKLEEICESWVRELLGLPERVVAGFVSGSSLAIFCGLAAARYRIFQNNNWDINARGFHGSPRIRIVAGRHAHGTVIKAIALLGFGIENIEWVETDSEGRILAAEVPELDENTILILQAGDVCSGAFDPFEKIITRAKKVKAWTHIDGAFGLWAAASSKLTHLTRGIENANSFSVDGHKTLNTPYDCGIVLCDDEEALTRALHASGSYIVNSQHRDGMFFTPEMSRRSRSVELWSVLQYLGKEGVDELIYGLHLRAVQLGEELRGEGFKILNDIVFNQVLVACDTEVLTDQTLKNIQQSGECWAGGASWNGKAVIRLSVCSWVTSESDITRTVKAFVAARQKAVEELPNP